MHIWLLFAFVSILSSAASTKVSFDHRALKIDGQRRLLISGCVHYPRSTPSMWPAILAKAKAGGLDVIETYLFWNYHEPQRGAYSFDGRFDVVQFMKAAHDEGLLVNLRVGPYVCAEWNYGGLPAWLRHDKDMVFRTYNRPWMSEMSTWMTYVIDYLHKRNVFAGQGGPVVLVQVENEYGNVESSYGPAGKQYVAWAAGFAQTLDVGGAVWTMCQQGDAPPGIINTCNGFYCHEWLDGHFKSFSNQPGMWTENWPGWFQDWDQAVPHRPVQDVAYAVARWYAAGGTFMNYYMYHGGTNFGRTAGGPFIVTSYDYDVMLDEYGLPHEPKYSHLKALHDVLHNHSAVILQHDPPQPTPLGSTGKQFAHTYGNVASGGDCIAFLTNEDALTSADVIYNGETYTLPAWSVTLLHNCSRPVYNTATIHESYVAHDRTVLPVNIGQSGGWGWLPEIIGTHAAEISSNGPLEQVNVTDDQTDYLWYSVIAPTPGPAGSIVQFMADHVDDIGYVFVNGTLQATVQSAVQARVGVRLPTGSGGAVRLDILSVTMGLQNYGPFLERVMRGVRGQVSLGSAVLTAARWSQQAGTTGEANRYFAPDVAKHLAWNTSASVAVGKPVIWWYGALSTPTGVAPVAVNMSSMGKGMLWVNGHAVGRYWLTTAKGSCVSPSNPCDYRGPFDPSKCRTGCGALSQSLYHVPRDWLAPTGQSNTVVMFEERGGDPYQIAFVTIQRPPV